MLRAEESVSRCCAAAGEGAIPAPHAVVFVPSRELSLQVQKARRTRSHITLPADRPVSMRHSDDQRPEGSSSEHSADSLYMAVIRSMQAASKVRRDFGLSACAVHGGVSIDVHAEALVTQNPGVVVATPGRARAMVRRRHCHTLACAERD